MMNRKRTMYLLAVVLISLIAPGKSFSQGVSVNSTGAAANSSAIMDVSSTTQGLLVPRMTTAQRNAIASAATGLLVYQTDGTTGFYFYNGGWQSLSGTTLPSGTDGQVLQLVSGSPAWVGNSLTIGASYGGGIVAYILQPGDPGYSALEQHGLIAATSDQNTGDIWGCNGNFLGATGILLGTGRNNTEIMLWSCGFSSNPAAYCKFYTGGGYTDWYLPSKDELNKLFINKAIIGGFTSNIYWSSSEVSATYAHCESFSDGNEYAFSKTTSTFRTRAVRSF